MQVTFHFYHLSPFIDHSRTSNHESTVSLNSNTTVDALLQNIFTMHWFNPETTITILTTIPQLGSTHIHKFTTLIEIGSHLLVTEASPEAIGSIPHFKKIEALTYASVSRIMDNFPHPWGPSQNLSVLHPTLTSLNSSSSQSGSNPTASTTSNT